MIRQLLSAKRGSVDYCLSGLASIATLYALGMSLAADLMAFTMAGVALGGTIFSYFVSKRFGHTKIVENSVWIYVVAGLASPVLSRNLNHLLPGGGFPNELLFSAAPIAWMLMLGAWFAWTDGTQTFQAVPAIAIFGLVGAFNTFIGATVSFFIFMVCVGALYARTHQRVMLHRATLSGYRQLEAIRQGPWKWQAGPEWALASSAAVILLSLIGAPIIQETVKGVSGTVRITPPQQRQQATTISNSAMGDSTRVGVGPRGTLSKKEVFRAYLNEPRHLRVGTYNQYSGGRWFKATIPNYDPRRRPVQFPQVNPDEALKNLDVTPFVIKFTERVDARLPYPSPLITLEIESMYRFENDFSISFTKNPSAGQELKGTAGSRKPTSIPTHSLNSVNEAAQFFRDVSAVSDRVIKWANDVSASGTNDWERANLVKAAITRQVTYNLNAEAAPEQADPVDWFLFGPRKEGYCDLFASAMVQGARAVGIPARYAVGYYPTDTDVDEKGFYILRSADYHAWAELYFEGYGWIAFDATEGAREVPGGGRGASNMTTPIWEEPWFGNVLYGLFGLVLVGGAALILKGLRSSQGIVDQVQVDLGEGYGRFVAALETLTGRPKAYFETPDEYVKAAVISAGSLAARVQSLNDRFVEAFYGPVPPTAEAAASLRQEASAFRAEVKNELKQRPRKSPFRFRSGA
jgi:transglutaminase-like putative cysteine protease